MRNLIGIAIILIFIINSTLISCAQRQDNENMVSVEIIADNTHTSYKFTSGISVREVLTSAGLPLNPLDKISPLISSVLFSDSTIIITRVSYLEDTLQEVIPFERLELPNETMSAGEVQQIQAGKNGILEKTIRRVFEDGIEVSSIVITEILLEAPQTEIIMVGVHNPFISLSIPGKIAYLNKGNAWIMEDSTSHREALVSTGDLDGRIFSLSPDGKWLLFSRISEKVRDDEINTLWVVNTSESETKIINLQVSNAIHFADWRPGTEYTISYSTVEPRTTAPGWQANNDLYFLNFDPTSDELEAPAQIIPSSSGGIYGWWGTTFLWSQDGTRLAYSRPDSIGLVNIEENSLEKVIDIIPLNTYSDWAWIPGLAWSQNNFGLVYVNHGYPMSLEKPEESPVFDLRAISFSTGGSSLFRSRVGIFSYPSTSPTYELGDNQLSKIICLQANYETQSVTSSYRVLTMDHDASDQHMIFPSETEIGVFPSSHWGSWSPESSFPMYALLYDRNIWMLNIATGISQQITGDGFTTRVDWK